MRALAALAVVVAAPAAANDICHDLWYTRNLVMDRAGYCFGSTLGQTVYDNRDCIGKSVSLSADLRDFVAFVQTKERANNCRVNTASTQLFIDDVWVRRQLLHLPVRDDLESACLNWIGPPTVLRAAADHAAVVIGQVTPDTMVHYRHLPVGDWSYVTVQSQEGAVMSGGWLSEAGLGETCLGYAG